MKKREKYSKGDKLAIAAIQLIAVIMFILVTLRLMGCGSEVEDIDTTVLECPEEAPPEEPVYCEYNYAGACCVFDGAHSYPSVYCYNGIHNCESDFCLKDDKYCWFWDKYNHLLYEQSRH